MKRRLLVLGIVVVTAAALTAVAFARHDSTLTLSGTDGPGYTINLKVGGKSIVRLKAGTSEAEGRQVQVLLPVARGDDVRPLHGRRVTRDHTRSGRSLGPAASCTVIAP